MKKETSPKKGKIERIKAQYLERRREFWPQLKDEDFWNRKKSDGFTTIPRVLPIVMRVMDSISECGPISSTYFGLWCRIFDSRSVLKIENPRTLAYEAGFAGQRGENTWKAKMKELVRLGFVSNAEGPSGEFNHICLPNPYFVMAKLKQEEKVRQLDWNALIVRSQEIGAVDLKTGLEKLSRKTVH